MQGEYWKEQLEKIARMMPQASDSHYQYERKEQFKDKSMFFYSFSPNDLKDYIEIFRKYSIDTNNEKYKTLFVVRLNEKNNEMLQKNIFPVECLLYASRQIARSVDDNDSLIKIIADVLINMNISMLSMKDIDMALENIIFKWDWAGQIMITLLYCGLTGNTILIKRITESFQNERKDMFKEVRIKLFIVKMLLATKEDKYSEKLLELVCNVEEGDKIILHDFSKYYCKNGFNITLLKDYMAKGTHQFKKVATKMLNASVLKNYHTTLLNTLATNIKKYANDKDKKESVDSFIKEFQKGNYRNYEKDKAFQSISYINQNIREKKNLYFGDNFNDIINICESTNYSKKKVYRALAQHIDRNKGIDFFNIELVKGEMQLEIYANLYIITKDVQYGNKILDAAFDRQFEYDESDTFHYFINYQSQFFAIYLSKIIDALKKRNKHPLDALRNLYQFFEQAPKFFNINQPIYDNFIDTISVLFKDGYEDERTLMWCLQIISRLRKNNKMPDKVKELLGDIINNCTTQLSVKIKNEAKDILKKLPIERPI